MVSASGVIFDPYFKKRKKHGLCEKYRDRVDCFGLHSPYIMGPEGPILFKEKKVWVHLDP